MTKSFFSGTQGTMKLFKNMTGYIMFTFFLTIVTQDKHTPPDFTCSKSTVEAPEETPEQCAEPVQS